MFRFATQKELHSGRGANDTGISIDAKETEQFTQNSVFENLEDVSSFFEDGELGFSPHKEKLEGLRLKAYNWKVSPLDVTDVKSSFFSNEMLFPKNSIVFDNALLMRNIEHEWIAEQSM